MNEIHVEEEKNSRSRFGASAFTLKLIAIISMVIDHYSVILYPMAYGGKISAMPPEAMVKYMHLRIIGRIAFPIFAYLIAEGFVKTGNIKKYIYRMLIFALISTPAYNIAFGQTFIYTEKFVISFIFGNVMWTFFFALIMLCIIKKIEEKVENVFFKSLLVVCTAGLFYLLGDIIKCDWHGFGIALVAVFYIFRKSKIMQMFFATAAIFMTFFKPFSVNLYAFLGLIPIIFYNGKRGKDLRYLFYAFYPAHLFVFALIRYIMYGVGSLIK